MEDNFAEFEGVGTIYRRSLLPWWILFFSWIFIIVGALSILSVIVTTISSTNPSVSFYALDVVLPNPYGQIVSAIVMAFNGLTGLYLWLEKKQAVQLGKICAITGIIICAITTIASLATGGFMIRLEIIFLVFFYNKLRQIEYDWELTAISRTGTD